MITLCYQYGKRMHAGENVFMLANKIVRETGMNQNSAIMYLYAVSGMLGGVVYKRAISTSALVKYFNMIFNEYGTAGLEKAIKATRYHVEYRRRFGHKVDSIERLCDTYQSRI